MEGPSSPAPCMVLHLQSISWAVLDHREALAWVWAQLGGSEGVGQQHSCSETRPGITRPRPEVLGEEILWVGAL